MHRIITALVVTIFLCGCAATAPLNSGSPEHSTAELGKRIAGHAISMVGTTYRYGGSNPETGFDCSGLVFYSFRQIGIGVPRTSLAQFRASRKISLSDAHEGDILFFEDQEKLSHVGVYIGAGRFVHAPASGRTVSIASLDNAYYQMHLVGIGRLLP